jgi:hypothetical protein
MAKSRNPTQPSKQRTRGASRYKRSETSRLLKGAADAGLTVRSFEVDPVTGALRVFVGKGGEPSDNGNSWDEVLNAQNAKRSA